jgi:hypothetical protein
MMRDGRLATVHIGPRMVRVRQADIDRMAGG